MHPAVHRAVRTVRGFRECLVRPPYVRPGHFYSPLTTDEDVERAVAWAEDAPGVDLREREQLELAATLIPMFDGIKHRRYQPDNDMYGPADAFVYHGMLRHVRPQRVIEVGSGHSTAMLLDTAEYLGLNITLTCIEPHPDRLLTQLIDTDEVEIIRKRVQDVPVDVFGALQAGDILFIDSTHVAKAGSDVLWLFLRVLPRLARGVIVHVHDLFWPFEYPEAWLREHRDWNEDYLLHAFLCHNDTWQIQLFSSWLWKKHNHLIPESVRDAQPGALWMRHH